MSGKDAFEVADKNGLQSSHHMSSHDSSQIFGLWRSFFQMMSFGFYRFSNLMLLFLFYFHKHITGNDDSDEAPNKNHAKITGKLQ